MSYKLKNGKSQEEIKQSDEKVSQIVSDTIKTIEAEGDKALRDLSVKFDKWSPESFKLSDEEIESIVNDIPQQVKDDIAFAQNNIQRFAEAQKNSLKDFETENSPGVILGQKNIPVDSVG
ncbi:histidinol dehydrogenase, partial [Mammaliicoccus fleurettii]